MQPLRLRSGQAYSGLLCFIFMARYEHLPIYKQALDVAVYFERAVAGFDFGLPALRPSGRAARVQNRSRRFCPATTNTR